MMAQSEPDALGPLAGPDDWPEPEYGPDAAAWPKWAPDDYVDPGPPSAASIGGRPAIGIDAADLLALDLPPLRWIVPDLLPEGTTILAAPPKVGKSCLVYQIAVEVAVGGELLGQRVAPGPALYLALEDGQLRGQDRLRAALAGRTMPRGRLEIRWSAPLIGDGLEEEITSWLDQHPDAAMVAIDTLQRVRPRSDGRRNAYEVDVQDLARLQSLFRDRRVALLIVHHANKAGSDDFLASVSGTYGITGSADTIIVIKRPRLEAFGQILVTGRDVPDAEISVRFENMLWEPAPGALSQASFERTEIYRAIEELGPIFPKALADKLGMSSRESVAAIVAKLADAGAVQRVTGGYIVPRARAGVGAYPPYSDSKERKGGHPRPRAHTREADLDPDSLEARYERASGEEPRR